MYSPPNIPLRIAMWSGPRNVSTAMMRSFENRGDCAVCDEPFYAHYLRHTGLPHPGAAEVIACHETDWRRVVEFVTGPPPGGKRIFYQKQMAHHLLPHIDRSWLGQVTNCFLIREPREMLTSLLPFIPQPTLADTGLPQQQEIFAGVRQRLGTVPAVVDAKDVLNRPRETLGALCESLGLDFRPAMLSWPPGPRATDGVWAKHWYGAVEKTTSFGKYAPKTVPLPAEFSSLLNQCEEIYAALFAARIQA